MTEIERWATVPGYSGAYEVSTWGRVRSMERIDSRGRRRQGKILSPGRSTSGHLTVALCAGGVCRTFYVHRLVLQAFVGPNPAGMEACHWNDDPTDNRLENLRWDTRGANARDSVRNGSHRGTRTTHCPQKHSYSEENTYNHPSGSRICRKCARKRSSLAVGGVVSL
jgi:hypothetical protein